MCNLKHNCMFTNTHSLKQRANFIPRPHSLPWKRYFDVLLPRVSKDYRGYTQKDSRRNLVSYKSSALKHILSIRKPRIFAWMPRFLANSVLIDVRQHTLLTGDSQLSLTWNVCQFPWYKQSRHCWFQATNMIPLNVAVGRDGLRWSLWAEPTSAPHYSQVFGHAMGISAGFTLNWSL